jgi:hypothetical protein
MSGSTDMLPCDCGTGITQATPASIGNRPGLAEIAYRVGVHSTFKESMLAALSSSDYLAIGPLTTREDSDFTVALIDAWAVTSDILTFYQERLANESYLRTAVQQRSVFELARLVGYQPSPGVAASAAVAFTMTDATGSPDNVTIPAATRVQSVPGPGQSPQTFETVAPITAQIAHNAIKPIMTVPFDVTKLWTSIWLAGTSTNLKPGDGIVFIDESRVGTPTSNLWEFRIVASVTTDPPNSRTLVAWDAPMYPAFDASATNVQLYAFRKRASLYGVNAPDPRSLSSQTLMNYGFGTAAPGDWSFSGETSAIDLDTVYPDIAPAQIATTAAAQSAEWQSYPGDFSWVVLSNGTYRKLYRILSTQDLTPRNYTLTGKATRLALDHDDDRGWFVYYTRSSTAFVQSDPLTIAPQPMTAWNGGYATPAGMLTPVEGTSVLVDGGGMLSDGQAVGVSGKRLRVQVSDPNATLIGADGRTTIPFAVGDVFLVNARPTLPMVAGRAAWQVLTTKGVPATLTADSALVTLVPAASGDAAVSEAAIIDHVEKHATYSNVVLNGTLANLYDRSTVALNGNAVMANHGETVQEILGGSTGAPNQTFTLKQSPLTYTSTAAGSGAQSTLQVWVNDIRWQQQDSLLAAGPNDRVFITRTDTSGTVTVQFGDGVSGARPPTSAMNIRALYRKGIGTAGMVATGQLSQPLDRPQGLKGVSNPSAASGGADPDSADDARVAAPLHVLTLDRVVSLEDYENYARAFAGVAKALASWCWFGRTRGVVVTVAGPGGAALDPNGQVIPNLSKVLRSAGNPYVPISILPFQARLFTVTGQVAIDTVDYDSSAVFSSINTALLASFGFGARNLGQSVAQSEVVAAIQSVPGVLAVQLTTFSREDQTTSLLAYLAAASPQPGERGTILPAEMLMIDPASLTGLVPWQ